MLHLNNIKTKYKELTYKNSSNYMWLMTILALANLVVFGLFGVVGGLGYANAKLKTAAEMSNIVANMQTKIAQLEEVKTTYNKAIPYSTVLNDAITNTPDMQSYLVQLEDAFAKSGFTLTKFTPDFSADPTKNVDSIQVSVLATGDCSNLGALLVAIEKLPRFTKVLNATASFNYKDVTTGALALHLEVYRSIVL